MLLRLYMYIVALTGLLTRSASDSCTDVEVEPLADDGCELGWPRILPCLRCNSSSYIIDISWDEVQSDDFFIMKIVYGDITRGEFYVKKNATGFVIPINKDIYKTLIEQIRFERCKPGCDNMRNVGSRVICFSNLQFRGCKPTFYAPAPTTSYAPAPTTSYAPAPTTSSAVVSTSDSDLLPVLSPTFDDKRWIAFLVPVFVLITCLGSGCYLRRRARRFRVFIRNYSENGETIQEELRKNIEKIPSILLSADDTIFANSCLNPKNTCYVVITKDEQKRIREDRSHAGVNPSFCGILKGLKSLSALRVSDVDNVLVVHNHDDPYFVTCNVRNGTPLGNTENGTPLGNTENGTPLGNTENGTPLENSENGTPLGNTENIAISADDSQNSTEFDNTTDNSPSINVEESAKWPCFCYPHDKTKIDQWILAVFKSSQLWKPTKNIKHGYTEIKCLNHDYLTDNPQTSAQTEYGDVGDIGNDESVLDHDLV